MVVTSPQGNGSEMGHPAGKSVRITLSGPVHSFTGCRAPHKFPLHCEIGRCAPETRLLRLQVRDSTEEVEKSDVLPWIRAARRKEVSTMSVPVRAVRVRALFRRKRRRFVVLTKLSFSADERIRHSRKAPPPDHRALHSRRDVSNRRGLFSRPARSWRLRSVFLAPIIGSSDVAVRACVLIVESQVLLSTMGLSYSTPEPPPPPAKPKVPGKRPRFPVRAVASVHAAPSADSCPRRAWRNARRELTGLGARFLLSISLTLLIYLRATANHPRVRCW